MNRNEETLKEFYDALERHNWDRVRALLEDNFRFRGPSQESDSADQFISTNRQISPEWKFSDHEIVESGDVLMSFFTTTMTRPAQGKTRCAERIKMQAGKLLSIELIYDSAAFRIAT